MAVKRIKVTTKSPDELLQKRSKHLSVTFRLDEERDALLRLLAKSLRGGSKTRGGPSTLARRIVEEYLDQHAKRGRK